MSWQSPYNHKVFVRQIWKFLRFECQPPPTTVDLTNDEFTWDETIFDIIPAVAAIVVVVVTNGDIDNGNDRVVGDGML